MRQYGRRMGAPFFSHARMVSVLEWTRNLKKRLIAETCDFTHKYFDVSCHTRIILSVDTLFVVIALLFSSSSLGWPLERPTGGQNVALM